MLLHLCVVLHHLAGDEAEVTSQNENFGQEKEGKRKTCGSSDSGRLVQNELYK